MWFCVTTSSSVQASQAQQEYLKNHIQTQSSALDSFNATNSALTSDSIGLQVLVGQPGCPLGGASTPNQVWTLCLWRKASHGVSSGHHAGSFKHGHGRDPARTLVKEVKGSASKQGL